MKAPFSEKAEQLFDALAQDEIDEMMASLLDEGSYEFDEPVETDDGYITAVRPVDYRYDEWDESTYDQ